MSASLASRIFEAFLLEVGFQGILVEIQVSEKLRAYTRIYEGGRASTRAKDLVDLTLTADVSKLDARGLRTPIESSFAERGTHAVSIQLPTPPGHWAPQFRQLAEAVGVPGDLEKMNWTESTSCDQRPKRRFD